MQVQYFLGRDANHTAMAIGHDDTLVVQGFFFQHDLLRFQQAFFYRLEEILNFFL